MCRVKEQHLAIAGVSSGREQIHLVDEPPCVGEHQQAGAEVELAAGKLPRARFLAGQPVYSIYFVLLWQQKIHISTRAMFTELIEISLCI